MRISDDRECKPSMYTKCYYHVVMYFTLESTPYTVPQQALIVTHDTHCVVLYNLYSIFIKTISIFASFEEKTCF